MKEKMSILSKINSLEFKLIHEMDPKKQILYGKKIYGLSKITQVEYYQILLILNLTENRYVENSLLLSVSLLLENDPLMLLVLNKLID